MDASTIPKGQSAEINGDGRPINMPGTYKHKETDATFITAEGSEGVVQADALMDFQKWGGSWSRVGDVPSRVELLKMRKAQETPDNKVAVIEASKKADKLPEGGETYDPKETAK